MTFKAILALTSTGVTFLLGAWHVSMTILLVFMCVDFLTGIAKGIHEGKLRSAVGFRGILKKGVIMLVIILANMLDLLVGGGTPVFRTMCVFFYIGNEGLSILENLGKMGVPVPKGIAQYIDQLAEEKEKQPEEVIQKAIERKTDKK